MSVEEMSLMSGKTGGGAGERRTVISGYDSGEISNYTLYENIYLSLYRAGCIKFCNQSDDSCKNILGRIFLGGGGMCMGTYVSGNL